MTPDIFSGQGYERFTQVDDTARHALHGMTFREIAKARDQAAHGSQLRDILERTLASDSFCKSVRTA